MILCRRALLLLLVALPWGSGCDSSPPVASISAAEASENSSPGRARETTFDDIKFEMEKTEKFERSMITPQIEELFGRRIRIRGYMFPTLKKRGLTQFVLVRDNMECCFGPGAALFDCILVHMQPGKTAEFSIRPVAVEGRFRFEEFVDYDGTIRAIYHLDGEAVN
jgi:hypothetical protein